MTQQEALKVVQEAMASLLPNFSAATTQAIQPKMLSTAEIANQLGLDTSANSVSAIKALLDAATNTASDTELAAQKNTENTFVRGLGDITAQLQAVKDALGSGAYSGVNKGMANANTLSELLNSENQSIDGLNTLLANRGTIAANRTNALQQNSSDALTQYNTIAQMLATLSKDNYANQIQQQTNELEANATNNDTMAGYYAANASTFADLLQALLGNNSIYSSNTPSSSGTTGTADTSGTTADLAGLPTNLTDALKQTSVSSNNSLGTSPAAKQIVESMIAGSGLQKAPNSLGTSPAAKKIVESMINGKGLQKNASTEGTNQLVKSASTVSDTSKSGTNSNAANVAKVMEGTTNASVVNAIKNAVANYKPASTSQNYSTPAVGLAANALNILQPSTPTASAVSSAPAANAVTNTGPLSNTAQTVQKAVAAQTAPSNFNALVNAGTNAKLVAAAKAAAALAKTSSVKASAKK